MVKRCHWSLLIGLGFMVVVHGQAASLRVDIEPVAFDSFQHQTGTKQPFSLTRLDCILSEIALKKPDGSWLGQRDWFAYLSLREGRDGFTLKDLPAGRFSAVRFLVGVRPEVNKADVSRYPPQHPLNPTVNTLYWGWQGGFVFMAIEGGWRRADGSVSGFSFHVATDPNLMAVELPVDLDTSHDLALKLKLDPAAIVAGVVLNDERNSTHSRSEDELAERLRSNIEHSFSIASVRVVSAPTVAGTASVKQPANETLHSFVFASHFPRPSLPADNPLTEESIALGKALFHDKRLSLNNTQSCADCHDARHAFSDSKSFSLGAEGEAGVRNAMPLTNLAWKQRYFWDGRASTLRDQVLRPIQDPVEMHSTLPEVEKKFSMSSDKLARALEQYLLTLVSDDAKVDRVMRGKDKFSAAEQRGFDLFHTEYDPRRGQYGADCFHCHGGALFQNVAFANNGLDVLAADAGLGAITQKPGDRGKFAVPSLRNVALTAPYMHDGRFSSLAEVIDHYDHGVQRSDTLDPNLAKHPASGLRLSHEDKAALVAFLQTLTGASFLRTP